MSTAFMAADSFLSTEAWQQLRRWYGLYGRHQLPWRRERSPWRVLVAETLLHRTRAEQAAQLYPAVIAAFPSPEAILARPERWHELTRSAGLLWRTEMFLTTCKILVEKHGGQVPDDLAALIALPGIGHYVAQTVICFGHSKPAVIVDTNTIRLAARVSGETLLATRHRSHRVHQAVARLGEHARASDAEDNFALLDLVALVCKPAKPQCPACPLRNCCITGRSGRLKNDEIFS
jgi:A/G-specific adenine glycosylase